MDEFDKAAFTKRLGRKIAKTRKSLGYSQDRLGLEAGLSRGVLSRIESGKADPQASTLQKIADTLGISVGKLF